MINDKDFSKSKPVIKPGDLKGANVAVVHVTEVEQTIIGGDNKLVVRVDEFPEHNYFPNLTSIRHLIDGLGADEKKWPGKPIVLEIVKTNDPVKKRQVDALWVAAADTWPEHFAEFARRVNPVAAVNTPAKSGDKKATTRRR